MKPGILLISLFLIGCRSTYDPVEMCGLIASQRIEVEMVSTAATEEPHYTLFGRSIDQANGLEMPFVKVIIMLGDSMVVGALTDIDGNFQMDINPGMYQLVVSYVGCESYTSELTALDGMKEEVLIEVTD